MLFSTTFHKFVANKIRESSAPLRAFLLVPLRLIMNQCISLERCMYDLILKRLDLLEMTN